MKAIRVIVKTRPMFRLLLFVFSFSLMITSCHRHEVHNKYKDAKKHPSDELNKESVKATKHVKKVFLKTQKKNKKSIGKHGRIWQKKGKQRT